MSRRQHHKGRKRPRSWHRSRSSQWVFWKHLRRINAVFEKAEADAEA